MKSLLNSSIGENYGYEDSELSLFSLLLARLRHHCPMGPQRGPLH
jgi:hypothetical protein